MRVGSKTLFTLAAAVFTAALGYGLELFTLERLGALDAGSAFVAGGFASLASALACRFGRLGEPSEMGVGFVDKNEPEAVPLWGRLAISRRGGRTLELPPLVHQLVLFASALTLAFLTLAGGTLHQTRQNLRHLLFTSSGMCPEEDSSTQEPQLPPGCELVVRAYEMGLAESLGRCALNQAKAQRKKAVCTLRQRDEPTLHYTYRLLLETVEGLRTTFSATTFGRWFHELQSGTQHLDTLAAAQWQILASKARASHHIFTNLPDPRPWFLAAGGPAFARTQCLERYRGLEHRPHAPPDPALLPSVRFDHIIGQLLFDTRYEPAAGFCREYTIHWGAKDDACSRLAADPEGFLSEVGAWDHVHHLVERYETSLELARLDVRGGESQPDDALRWVVPQRFVSFHCYQVEPRDTPTRRSLSVSIRGHAFSAEELRVFPASDDAPPIELYNEIASLLVSGFHYGDLESGATLAGAGAVTPQRFLRGQDGYLSRLDYFGDVDVYAGQGWWVLLRDDLFDVYPHHVHMASFIEAFRMQYRLERGRL